MKKMLLPMMIFMSLILFILNCESGKENNSGNENNKEAVELEKIKVKKKNEADSLKAEIEILKSKRDSLNKAMEDEPDRVK
jgi:cell division protein FtsB